MTASGETGGLTVADLSPGNDTITVRFRARYSSDQAEVHGFYHGLATHPDLGVLLLISDVERDDPLTAIQVDRVVWCRKPVTPYVEVSMVPSGGTAP